MQEQSLHPLALACRRDGSVSGLETLSHAAGHREHPGQVVRQKTARRRAVRLLETPSFRLQLDRFANLSCAQGLEERVVVKEQRERARISEALRESPAVRK